jgi:hypothetical protein
MVCINVTYYDFKWTLETNNLKQSINSNNFTNMNVIITIDVSLIENGQAKPSSLFNQGLDVAI